jgi:hypothetical protein
VRKSWNGQTLHRNQAGLTSFLILTVVMAILTLILLSFARIVQREQRQTLDRQLHSQAFYAAESGVNDALDALRNTPTLANTDYTTACNGAGSFIAAATLTNVIDPAGGISYSCLLVDNSPPELNVPTLGQNRSTVLPIRAKSGAPIIRVEVWWQDAAGETDITNCPVVGSFPPAWNTDGLCDIGIIRVELVPFNNVGATTRDQLFANRRIAFLQPRTSGFNPVFQNSAVYFMGDNQGRPFIGNCTAIGTLPRRCRFSISNVNFIQGYLRLRSVYRDTSVTVRGFTATGQTELIGAQVEIDATGKANDVLKRIKVAAPIPTAGDQSPEFALHTKKTQCKRFTLFPGGADPVWFAGPDFGYCDPLAP